LPAETKMFALSPEDREFCRDRTLQVLDRTLHDYADTSSWESGGANNHACMKHDGWKQLHSQSSVSLYAERATDLAWVSAMRGGRWRHPVSVVAIGRMGCSLTDVLYGLVASDPAEFKLRAVLMNEKADDDVEVASILTPNEAEPFRFMGVARYVTTPGCMRRPQECVLLIATGEVFTSCGEHLGYEICQSVAIAQWPASRSMTRKQTIQARVLRELPDGSVGVYYKVTVDSTSCMPDGVLQASLWHTVQNFWRTAPCCAGAKKLCYCVEHKSDLNLAGRCSPGGSDPFTCGVCGTKLLKHRGPGIGDLATSLVRGGTRCSSDAYRCVLCSSWLCAKPRCCTTRQLARVDRATMEVTRQPVVLCTCCNDTVQRKDAADIARRALQEVSAAPADDHPFAGSCAGRRTIAQPPTAA